jgi:protein-S-isoprenylcysteine O-methyltransferase Ste14
MLLIYIQLIGCGILIISSVTVGFWLRRHPTKLFAERTTRTVHAVANLIYLIPLIIILSRAGFTQYDKDLGIPLLPFQSILQVVGTVMILLGVLFMLVSILNLAFYGKGLPAFSLSEKLTMRSLFARTRNPMSLGFYLICISVGLLAGSTFFMLFSLTVLIPSHIVFLKYFEEIELELRFGQPYIDYKNSVPFLFPKIFNVYMQKGKS